MIHSGRLRHRVTIQQQSISRDSHGQKIMSWTDYKTVYAAVEPLQGREFFSSDAINSEVTTRIRIRWTSGIDTTMRVSFDSRIYNIKSVITPKEIHEEMQLMCKEGVDNG